MFETIALYIRQRFNLPLFSLTTLFLLLYANGLQWNPAEFVGAFLYMLALLFWFRLFDDIASREIDAGRDRRIYTEKERGRQLAMLLAPLAVVLVAVTLLVNISAGGLLGSFMLLNWLAYRLLFGRGNWRLFLPLLKYPFFALLLFGLFSSEMGMSIQRALLFLSLLPVWILFEWLDDPSFRLRPPVAGMLLVGAHLLLIPMMEQQYYPAALAGLMIIILLAYASERIRIWRAPYLLMLYFLALRLWTT